ncbi:MAG: endo-1,4-beta-xylanase, partial [Oscillospiraceae bacterium]|nr:endo-1,4-beta-xylanase [Oscillospiraceae bacterium]
TKVGVNLGGAARSVLNFCRDNKIPVRGHVLVWHSQTPGWFFKEDYTKEGAWVDKETMLARMENYISGVMAVLAKEYPDVDFYAWDVVNEAWLDNGSPREGGMYDDNPNQSGWTQVFGDNSFIPYAFEYARKYAPEGCKLYYNDFNEYMPDKTTAIVNMANELKERNLIDGIGMQSHLDVTFPSVSAYRKALAAFAATGLDIQVTELDATTSDLSKQGFETQAQYYSDIMDAIVEYKDNISAVVFWGTTDDMSWRAEKSPLLFNRDYTAKPAFYSIIDGIDYNQPDTTGDTTESTASSDETTEPTPGTGVSLYGDVDLNGTVNIMDVILLNRSLMIGAKIEPQGMVNADVDDSGSADATDSLNILKAVVQLITLPVQ